MFGIEREYSLGFRGNTNVRGKTKLREKERLLDKMFENRFCPYFE